MIRLFGAVEESLSSNGDLIIRPLKARVHKEDNGAFYLDLETDLSYVDELTQGRIIVCDTPQGEQAFRVSNPKKTKHKLSTKALHVFYDSENYLIEDTFVVDKNANAALDQLNMAATPSSPFTTISDLSTIASYRCVRTSLHDAVLTVVERWGGHIARDNWEIGLRANIGADNGVTVQYRKNLKDITCQEDWEDVCTKLLPVGWDGIMLPEVYVESDVQYSLPYVKSVYFSQDIDEDEYPNEQAYQQALIADLRQKATAYVEEHSIPNVNYTLSADLEKITDIGDTVHVQDSRLGISIDTNVISFDYDPILKKYTQVQFGNFQPTIKNLRETIAEESEKSSETVRVTLSEELREATDKIWAALGNSYVIYNGDYIMIVDSLPAEEATYVIMIDSGGIGFSSTGINGTFNSAWTIDGTFNAQNINVINFTADLIKGGTLKLGTLENEAGTLEVYDEDNNLIGVMDKDGLKMYGTDGSYVIMNNTEGFAGYDANGNKLYWADSEQFHMTKAVVEEEITLCNRLRFIDVEILDSNDNIVNQGIGLVTLA